MMPQAVESMNNMESDFVFILLMPSYRGPSVRYHRIGSNDDGFVDAQFARPPPKIPYKSIGLAIFLFCLGSLLLIIGGLLFTGHFNVKYADRTYPVLILGSLLFIPGFYHIGIAYMAWRGYQGYSYRDIPDFES